MGSCAFDGGGQGRAQGPRQAQVQGRGRRGGRLRLCEGAWCRGWMLLRAPWQTVTSRVQDQ